MATKRKEKVKKCQKYDENIGYLALSEIEFGLDNGVKANYEKVQAAKESSIGKSVIVIIFWNQRVLFNKNLNNEENIITRQRGR